MSQQIKGFVGVTDVEWLEHLLEDERAWGTQEAAIKQNANDIFDKIFSDPRQSRGYIPINYYRKLRGVRKHE